MPGAIAAVYRNAKLNQKYEADIAKVLGGSDDIKGFTDQGMPTDPIGHLHRPGFPYIHAVPASAGIVLLHQVPDFRDVQRHVEPLLGGFTMMRLPIVGADGMQRDMFIDELATLKDLPFNARATGLMHGHLMWIKPNRKRSRGALSDRHCRVFDEQVLFD